MSKYVLRVTAGPFKGMFVGNSCLTSEEGDALRFSAKSKAKSEARRVPGGVPVEFVEAVGDGS